MEENKYLDYINRELDEFQNKKIQIVPGFEFNQKDTIERVYRLYNSKFENGDIDADGDKKYFFNVVKNPCKVTTKAIDFDTKDIRILTAGGGTPLKTWFYERDLKFWMRDKNFGKVLNRIFNEIPIFGSVVLKVIKGVPYFVDLRNFIVSPSADTLDDANYIIERHLYSPQQFMKMGKKFGWNNVDKTIEEFRKMKDVDYICVYERYGEMEKGEEGNKKYPYKRLLIADVGVNEYNEYTREKMPYTGVILQEDEISEHPYWEFHFDKLPGRWLGVGVVEILTDPQIRQNEIANLQAKGSYWSALRVFQTRDQGVNRNLMTDVRNGEVLRVDGELTPVDMQDRNLAFFNEETQKWMQNRDELSNSYDVVQGERLPSGTPLGSAKLAAGMSMSFFAQIQENIALDIKEFLYDVILPSFEKENNTEHLLRLVGEDLDELNTVLTEQNSFIALLNSAAKGIIPTKQEFELMKTAEGEKLKQQKERMVKIPKGFYDGLKYKIDIVITGESQDPDNAAQVEFAALQAITADPTILQDPLKKKIFFSILEKQGVDITKFDSIKPMDVNQMMQGIPQKGAGGGVSAPVQMAPNQSETKI